MATTYVSERQVEYSTSRQIENVFRNAGFDMSVRPIEQNTERYLPSDHIFYVNGLAKIFGIQYKVLYRNGEDHWRMNARQHSTLQRFPWIYYGLSDLKSDTGIDNSLNHLRLYKNNIRLRENNHFMSKLRVSSKKSYTGWATFYEELLQCNRGFKVNSKGKLKEELTSYLMPDIEGKRPDRVTRRISEMADVFVINVKSRKALHLSSHQ